MLNKNTAKLGKLRTDIFHIKLIPFILFMLCSINFTSCYNELASIEENANSEVCDSNEDCGSILMICEEGICKQRATDSQNNTSNVNQNINMNSSNSENINNNADNIENIDNNLYNSNNSSNNNINLNNSLENNNNAAENNRNDTECNSSSNEDCNCEPGVSEVIPCGDCGIKERICNGNRQWTSYSGCVDPGHLCPDYGIKSCVDQKHYKTCGDSDANGCFEWSGDHECLRGQICLNGNCIEGCIDSNDCAPMLSCINNECICQPDCTGKQCGDNGCGSSCGDCNAPPIDYCLNSNTLRTYQTGGLCTNGQCNYNPQEVNCPYGCSAAVCRGCNPDCTGNICGNDGCGGSCGACLNNETCVNGNCECIPECNGKDCGNNGCGGVCGLCESNETCSNGICECIPDCNGKTCGNNGCGDVCGNCSWFELCNSEGTCKYKNPVSFLTNPGPDQTALWLTPKNYNGNHLGKMGNGNANWYVSEKNIPNELRSTPIFGQGTWCSDPPGGEAIWHTANQHARICLGPWGDSTYQIELAQNGAEIPCDKAFSLYISPNNDLYSSSPQGIIEKDNSPDLSSMSSLIYKFGTKLIHSGASERCGQVPQCGGAGEVDFGFGTAIIVLSNTVNQNTLYFQVYLYDTRANESCALDPCDSWKRWFSKQHPFGVTNSIGSYNKSCLKSGTDHVLYEIDILPKLKNDIMSGPPETDDFDNNLSNWRVSNIVIGIGLMGSVGQTMVVDHIGLTGHF